MGERTCGTFGDSMEALNPEVMVEVEHARHCQRKRRALDGSVGVSSRLCQALPAAPPEARDGMNGFIELSHEFGSDPHVNEAFRQALLNVVHDDSNLDYVVFPSSEDDGIQHQAMSSRTFSEKLFSSNQTESQLLLIPNLRPIGLHF